MKSESRIQQEIVMWYNNTYCLQHHENRCMIFSVPNETSDKMELRKKMATGMLAGVSDLIVITPNKLMFVECKDDKGIQSPNQKDFESRIKTLGYEYHLVRSLEEFKTILP